MKRYVTLLFLLFNYNCIIQNSLAASVKFDQETTLNSQQLPLSGKKKEHDIIDNILLLTAPSPSLKPKKHQKSKVKPISRKALPAKKKITLTTNKLPNSRPVKGTTTVLKKPPVNNPGSNYVKLFNKELPALNKSSLSDALDHSALHFGKIWFVDRSINPLTHVIECLLKTKEQSFNDGYDNARISITISADSLLIKTDSKIDLSYPDIGLFVDQATLIPFQQLLGDSNILIEGRNPTIMNLLRLGKKLTIRLGFWPTWPKKETPQILFSLTHFSQAYRAMLACQQL